MKEHMINLPEPFQVQGNLGETHLNIDLRTYTNAQLLNFIIGSESYNVLMSVGHSLNQLASKNVYDLMKIRGIGPGKALRIMATIELGKRRHAEIHRESQKVTKSEEVYNYFAPFLLDLPHEEFWLLFIRRNNSIICSTRIGVGGVAGVVVDPKIVFRTALEYRACGLILCHNHPSGSVEPSSHDVYITRKIIECGKHLDIYIGDHVIIGGNKYYSFADNGLLH